MREQKFMMLKKSRHGGKMSNMELAIEEVLQELWDGYD